MLPATRRVVLNAPFDHVRLCVRDFGDRHAQADLEMMTWPELKKAIEGGKTTALVYNGGTETRGPHASTAATR
jgi:hypothetical protein